MVQEYIQYIKKYNMKLFVYKSLFTCLLIFILFHLTIGYIARSYEAKIYNTFSKDKINFIKEKIRSEIKAGIEKDQILSDEDTLLINQFLEKISKELNKQK